MKPYKDKILAFVDCETTGLNLSRHEIIEIGALLFDHNKDEILNEWSVKIKPNNIAAAEQEALKINGYLNNPDAYTHSLKASLNKLNKFTKGCIVVGQNIAFDLAFLKKAMSDFNIKPKWDNRSLELMSLSWFYAISQNLNGLSLNDLCSDLKISNAGAHSALIDCRRSLGVYRCLNGIYHIKQK